MAAWWQMLIPVGIVTYSMKAADYSPLEKTTVNSSHTAGEYKSFTLGHISPQHLRFLPKYADRAERHCRLSDRRGRQWSARKRETF